MQTNRKSLGVIMVILGIIIIALIIYFWFFFGKSEIETPPVDNNGPVAVGQLPGGDGNPTTTPSDNPRNNIQYDLSKEAPHQINESDVIKMANSFAERFGSFSNYSNYSNFSDLEIFMTANMREWAKNYVAELKAAAKDSDSYYGITTTAITGKTLEFDDKAGTAKIVVTTQRQENSGDSGEGKSYSQDIEIVMKKVNGDWLADHASWQTK